MVHPKSKNELSGNLQNQGYPRGLNLHQNLTAIRESSVIHQLDQNAGQQTQTPILPAHASILPRSRTHPGHELRKPQNKEQLEIPRIEGRKSSQ